MILIADDDNDTRYFTERWFQAQGYLAVSVADGASALRLAGTLRPALIVLDHMLPGMDGIQVCRSVRNDPALRAVPVAFYSADAAGEAEALGAGADAYFVKGVSRPQAMLEFVRRCVGPPTIKPQKP